MEPFTIIGIDPGSANPGAAELERSDYGWSVSDMPRLGSDGELVDWISQKIHNPPRNLKLVAVENVRTSVFWGENGHGSAQQLECIGMARILARVLNIPLALMAFQTIRKLVLGQIGTKGDLRFVLSRMVRFWPKNASLHQSDAAAIAMSGWRQQGLPSESGVSEVVLEKLKGKGNGRRHLNTEPRTPRPDAPLVSGKYIVKLLAFLEDGPKSAAQIKEAVGFGGGYRMQLSRLTEAGIIRKVEPGVFARP